MLEKSTGTGSLWKASLFLCAFYIIELSRIYLGCAEPGASLSALVGCNFFSVPVQNYQKSV